MHGVALSIFITICDIAKCMEGNRRDDIYAKNVVAETVSNYQFFQLFSHNKLITIPQST